MKYDFSFDSRIKGYDIYFTQRKEAVFCQKFQVS